MRACARCGEQKTEDAFRLRKSSYTHKHYRGRVCKKCHGARAIEWKRRNPDKVRANNLKQRNKPGARAAAARAALASHYRRRFGITVAQRDEMLVAQGGACKVCSRTTPTRRGWCVDHCHTTGNIRGILCAPCNSLLGLAGESIAVLDAAIQYLKGAP